METIFGFKWPVPTGSDFFIFFFLLFLVIFIFIILKLYYFLKNEKTHAFHLFLYKVSNLGLTTFKIKILQAIVDSLSLRDPNKLLAAPLLFEEAVNRYNKYLAKQNESIEARKAINDEIVEVYQKIYFPSVYQKELNSISEMENGGLLRIIINDKYLLTGKVAGSENLIRLIAGNTRMDQAEYKVNDTADVFFYRSGDGGYAFKSGILSVNKNIIELSFPQSFKRIKPVRRPDIEVDIHGNLKLNETDDTGEEEQWKECNIYKINTDEIYININENLDFSKEYMIRFEIEGISLNIKCSILSVNKIKGHADSSYTMKLHEVSEPVIKILNSVISTKVK
jgi:hypothetical protein